MFKLHLKLKGALFERPPHWRPSQQPWRAFGVWGLGFALRVLKGIYKGYRQGLGFGVPGFGV